MEFDCDGHQSEDKVFYVLTRLLRVLSFQYRLQKLSIRFHHFRYARYVSFLYCLQGDLLLYSDIDLCYVSPIALS